MKVLSRHELKESDPTYRCPLQMSEYIRVSDELQFRTPQIRGADAPQVYPISSLVVRWCLRTQPRHGHINAFLGRIEEGGTKKE